MACVLPKHDVCGPDFSSIVSDFGSTFSGVLTDELGRVQAIWGSFSTQVYAPFMLLKFIPAACVNTL